MNAEKFTFYIKNPAHLYQITYTELKSLVLQYPYCQNLRYLLLKKSILENHPERDQNLQLAATFSADRNLLYKQIKEGDSFVSEADSFMLKEEYLELKELSPQQEQEEPILSLQQKGPVPTDTSSPEDIIPIEESNGEIDSDSLISESELSPETTVTELAKVPEKQAEDSAIPQENSNYLDYIDEEEIDDITDEMDDIFEEGLADLEIAPLLSETEEETSIKPEPLDSEEKIKREPLEEDEAISIEELIKLDSLSPLERMEKSKSAGKTKKKHTEEKNEEQTEGMKKKEFDFEEIDALIEKTKKDVPLEITNEESLELTDDIEGSPSPKSSFGSWLKQFQAAEEKEEPEETFDIPVSKTEEVKSKKSAKKKTKKKKKSGEKKKKSNSSKSGNLKVKAKDSEAKSKNPKNVAQKSLKENNDLVSETLANLLVKQENYKKAIKMYEKLSLIFPEKSGFFAEQIKKLKNL